MKKVYKPKEFSAMLGVTVQTLQSWDNANKLIAYRNPHGRRFYTHEQYEAYMGIQNENKVEKIVIYGRVSSAGQKEDLANQLSFLRDFANARGLIVDDVLTDIGSGLNYNRKKWNALLDDCFEGNVSTILIAQAIMNGDKDFKNFFKGLAKFPRFKKKKNQDVKAYFPKNNPTDLTVERHRIKVPMIGWVRLKEFGYIPIGANVINCTLSEKAGRYFFSVLCDIEEVREVYVPEHDGIGVDVGVSTFASCSHHVVFENINKTHRVIKLEKSLKRQQRKLSRSYEQNKHRERGEFCAKNRQKQLVVVQKLHARLANTRKEYVRHVVDALVKTKPAYLTIEDLNVTGMMNNRHLSKVIAQQTFYAFREWLEAKCKEKGIELRMVSGWYPSSKLCSNCGDKKTNLSLSKRLFTCDNCETVLDRDFNASLNLKYAKEYTVVT